MMASSRPSADREFSFLVDACAPALRSPATNDVDWGRVVRLARRHRVYPRLWSRHGNVFPEQYATAIRALAAENALNALRNLARTAEVVRLLRLAGIESIVLKGPLLSHDLYGDVALRVAGDVDVLVRERELLAAAQALAAAGYRPDTPLTPTVVARYRKRSHDLSLAHPDDGSLVELHADIAQPHYGYHIDFEEWWAARRSRALGSETVWSPSLPHAHLFTALHAAKHRWHRLDLISDIAAFDALGIDPGAHTWMLKPIDTGQRIAAWLFERNGSHSGTVSKAVRQLVTGEEFGRLGGLSFDLALRAKAAEKAKYLWKRLITAKL
jgi:hypothetical protein